MHIAKQNIFFIGDFHIFHKSKSGGILTLDNTYDENGKKLHEGRPFKDIEEMHESLIQNWNNIVTNEDIVYYMGDLSFGRLNQTKNFVDRLNGQIVLIKGNHDSRKLLEKTERFSEIHDTLKVFVEDENYDQGYNIMILQHYPILSWEGMRKGYVHLHSHMHFGLYKSAPWFYSRRTLDMGCMGWDYTPVSYHKIVKTINHRIQTGIINDTMDAFN